MLALWIIGGMVILLFSLLMLPVKIQAHWAETMQFSAKIGPFSLHLPSKDNKNRQLTSQDPEKSSAKKEKTKKKKISLTFQQWLQLISAALEGLKKGLKKTRQRIRINPLQVCVTFGGSDPADIAQNFGQSNALMWSVMPVLERWTNMPDPHIHLGMDYDLTKTKVQGELGIFFRIGDILAVAFAILLPIFHWYRQFTRMKKNRNSEKPDPA